MNVFTRPGKSVVDAGAGAGAADGGDSAVGSVFFAQPAVIETAIAALPPNQREVITLRDIDGLSSDEVCNILQISETNQRVLLHRARARVRMALAHYLAGQ